MYSLYYLFRFNCSDSSGSHVLSHSVWVTSLKLHSLRRNSATVLNTLRLVFFIRLFIFCHEEIFSRSTANVFVSFTRLPCCATNYHFLAMLSPNAKNRPWFVFVRAPVEAVIYRVSEDKWKTLFDTHLSTCPLPVFITLKTLKTVTKIRGFCGVNVDFFPVY